MPADIELIFRARPGDDQRCGVGRGAGRPPAAVRVMCVCTDIYTAFCHVSYVIASHHQSSVFRTLVQTAEFCQQSRSLFLSKQASKHIYLSTKMTGYQKKPLAQQCWQPIVSTTVKKSAHTQKKYILATPHNHNITLINTKEQQ